MKSSPEAIRPGESSFCEEHWGEVKTLFGSEKNAISEMKLKDKRSVKK
jgi:hypothetical protein